jgi:hypothetical protein
MPVHHGGRGKKSIAKSPAPFKPKNLHWIRFDCLPKVAEDGDDLAVYTLRNDGGNSLKNHLPHV